jgi:2-oxoglutarate dehydrogenase E1 component
MNRSTVANRGNLELIEENYQRWLDDPSSVDESWQFFFQGYDLGRVGDGRPRDENDPNASQAQAAVTRLVDAYREMGHYLANLDPLGLERPQNPHDLFDLAAFRLTEADLDRTFYTRVADPPYTTLRNLIEILKETYCRTIGVEFMHIRNTEVRKWLIDRMEGARNRPQFDRKRKRRILLRLNAAELFETFLHKRYIGQKRFSLEGGETLIPLLDTIIERSSHHGMREIVMGMPHRGRLSVLANIMNKPYSVIFGEFEENLAESIAGDGDVKYHLGFSADIEAGEGHIVHVSLTPNPSHLEAVNPVVEGRMRAKQRRFKDRNRKLGLPVLIHGDAAFAGQGLVPETLNLSQLPGYKTGGTIHIVVNNQIGFTTVPADGRSTRYCTDVAKMIEVPIFHVNGEDPEAVVYVAELALDFRQTFGQDVVIDMVCYRKHGHNETDEPAFTQPLMVKKIKEQPGVRARYTNALIEAGDLSQAEADTITETFTDKMEAVYREVHNGHTNGAPPAYPGFKQKWEGFTPKYSFTPIDTGVPRDQLESVGRVVTSTRPGFKIHPKLENILNARLAAMVEGNRVDWGMGEALAFGSLVKEGIPVRLSGQDCRRGTFSHRHASLVDPDTGERYVPLSTLGDFSAYDSLLSEAAVLGFEYGYSLDEPNILVLWEAQFGDFANGAQVIIDQFVASAESKWGRSSGLVMLLPHGYEGQGPEHSSARLERFLQLCAEDNIQVAYPTTPAQYFHMLRRQVKRKFRKPLVVMTPKSLLRHKLAVSTVESLVSDRFHDVLDDPANPERARRVLLCSGKVYYDLVAKREEFGKEGEVAIIRLEQLYPWPADSLKATVGRYRAAKEWVWVQEESQNMGGWTFVAPRLAETLGKSFQYVGRDASASPATGSHHVHDREQTELVEAAIGAAIPHVVSATPARPAVALTSKE